MSIIGLVIQKLKAFRMTAVSVVMLVMASYRALTSGESIWLVGVCAAVVPFFCQFKKFHRADASVSEVQDVFAGYLTNLLLMVVYYGWMLLMTGIGRRFVPAYVQNPYFVQMLFIAIAADMVFISAVIPLCRDLKPMQRMLPGLVLTNGLLVFMMMAAEFVKTATLTNLPMIACGFSASVLILTCGLIFAAYRKEKTE